MGMLSFKPYVPYSINRELLDTSKLEPSSRGEKEPANKTAMSIEEVLRTIGDNAEYTFDVHLYHFDVDIGADHYSFDNSGGSFMVLKAVLNAGKAAGGVFKALGCTWYYIEEDRLIDYMHEYYHFFVCRGDCVLDPSVTISDGPPFTFPQAFLLEDTQVYLSNDVEDRIALTRICYEKWEQETLPGRIYAMKAKIEQEQELAKETGINSYLTSQHSLPLLLRELSLVTKHLSYIKGLLFAIIGILLYIVLFKLR